MTHQVLVNVHNRITLSSSEVFDMNHHIPTAVWRGLQSRRLLRRLWPIQPQFGQHRIDVRQYSTRRRQFRLQRGGHLLPLERRGQLGEPEAELPLERRVSLLRLKNIRPLYLVQ